ncbi:MAG TPA: hypothetical protein VMM78_04655 [Thermomicrobiales bacterium]|nr:hypothetical protein [Thermomicrobiales bacterium]
MEWSVVLPRLRRALAPTGFLALASREETSSPWRGELLELVKRFTTNREFQPYDLVTELESRRLFHVVGLFASEAVAHRQSVDSYVESMHSRNGFSRDRMTPSDATAFDRELRRLLERYGHHGLVELSVVGRVTWGIPAPPQLSIG